jgi:hypothetical protein
MYKTLNLLKEEILSEVGFELKSNTRLLGLGSG